MALRATEEIRAMPDLLETQETLEQTESTEKKETPVFPDHLALDSLEEQETQDVPAETDKREIEDCQVLMVKTEAPVSQEMQVHLDSLEGVG